MKIVTLNIGVIWDEFETLFVQGSIKIQYHRTDDSRYPDTTIMCDVTMCSEIVQFCDVAMWRNKCQREL